MQREKFPPGPVGLGLDPPEMVPAAMTWRSITMQKFLSPELAQVVDDISFLANHAECPQRQRELLFLWVQEARQGVQSELLVATLCDVIDALVTISHGNAAFSVAPMPLLYRGKPEINIDDQGGFFAGKQAILALIKSDFTPDDLRLTLTTYTLARIDRDMSGIEKLLTRI
jgi:hypothetical protein